MSYPTISRSISTDELREHFTITDKDQELLQKKGRVHRLGLATLLKTCQFLGYAPNRKNQIPSVIVEWIAEQLGLDASLFDRYPSSNRAWRRHQVLVREHLGVCPMDRKGEDSAKLTEWLVEQARNSPSRKELTFLAVEWCKEHRIELPAEESIRRLVNAVRNQFFNLMYSKVHSLLDPTTRARMKSCLSDRVTKKGREKGTVDAANKAELATDYLAFTTTYDWLKSVPGKIGLATILDEVEKLRFIRSLEIEREKLFGMVSPNVLVLLRNRARNEDAGMIARHPERVRLTLLAALMCIRETEITDQIIRILLDLIRKIDKKSERVLEKELVGSVKKVWGKKQLLFRIAIVSAQNPDTAVRDAIYPEVSEEVILRLVEEAEAENVDYEVAKSRIVQKKYKSHYRRMMRPVLDVLTFRSDNSAHKPILDGLDLVKRYLDTNHTYYPDCEDIPMQLLTGNWTDLVLEDNPIGTGKRAQKHQFEVCVLNKLERALKCKEIWVEGAFRFRNPAADLPADWETIRVEHYQKCNLPLDPKLFIDKVRTEMSNRLDAFNTFIGKAKKGGVEMRHPGGGDRGVIYVPPLPKRDERPIIKEFKGRIVERWGVLDLLDMLVEADRHVNFSQFFETSGQRQILHIGDVRRRLLLVLFSLGTNLGLKRIYAAARPDCSYDDLRYFRDRYVTIDSVRMAIATLVNRILEVRNPLIWGNGTSCASDGKYIGAWDQNLVTQWHPRYRKSGVMAYWHVDTNSTCIYSKMKRPLSSEVAAMIEGLVRHDTEMRVERNFVDSHGQSEVAFAFARILTVELMPRLKRIKYERLYLPDKGDSNTWPKLTGVLARPIRWEKIEEQYDEMIRHVVAAKEGTAPVDSILRRFNRYNQTHPTYKAFIELGKALKTTFLCDYLQNLELRQEIHEGLNVVENWNSIINFIFYGRKSDISSNDPEQQELSILCMHLLQNSLILANTIMLERVIGDKHLVLEEADRRAITPLFTVNVNPYGDFTLDLEKPSFLEAA